MKNVVVRLGGFHTLMSYLGAIGYIMGGSGLEDIWSTVYADESVKHMMSGKAFSRALRAHILTYTAIGLHLIENVNDEITLKDKQEFDQFLCTTFQSWNTEPPCYEECTKDPVLKKMTECLLNTLETFKSNGPTSKLFIQYFEMVTIVLQFIEAERLGNWKLHLQSVEKMLPYFHASGHYLYAKSAQIYLQSMLQLEMNMEYDEFWQFTEGGAFTIRRSQKAWAGIWSDMTIEQTLNRFFGTDLKHGRGVSPSVVARYLTCMPISFAIMDGLETYCDFRSETSEQHVDLSDSRLNKDNADLKRMNDWLLTHKPFEYRESLTSLSTGIVGAANINCHEALKQGHQSMAAIVGKNAQSVSMSCKYKVKPLSVAQSGVHVDSKCSNVDSMLLFQRICVLTKDNEDLTKKSFSYELSPFPLSLFDKDGIMRKNKKSELFTVFQTSLVSDSLLSTFSYVIDGGFLLHQINWSHGKTYEEVFQQYYRYIVTNYNERSIVVFDGYNSEQFGVKSYERYRRKEKNVAADVVFDANMLISLTQTKFLSNIGNKQKFVELLAKYLRDNGMTVFQADEDADILIVNTAIDLSKKINTPVSVVGNDVDLLVLLVGLTPTSENVYFYKVTASKRFGNMLYCTSENNQLKNVILFAHAFAGCDTTSAIFSKGKKSIIKLLQKNESLREISQLFYDSNSNVESLEKAARKFILMLYGIDDENLTIGEIRYQRFVALVSQAHAEIRLSSLPPTSSALLQHAKRVFYQIQKWSGNNLRAEEWGWKRVDMMMVPIMTTVDTAPKELLAKVINNIHLSFL